MANITASSALPYLRSCKKECSEPITGEVKGEIPKWLKGTLIRVGPGLMELGPDRYNHVFDGLALMHAFRFENGSATYRNRFLRSDAYKKNHAANRIVVSEFGTNGVPDPCKTIFQRFSSLFSLGDFTDNDLVNIIRYSDEVYACSETSLIWRINPDDLESIQKVNLSDFVSISTATAHSHEDRDGTVYNVGNTYGRNGSYDIIKFLPKKETSDGAFDRGSVVCRIPNARSLNPSYFHSFGMTDNYFIFVEQPLYMSLLRMAWTKFMGSSYENAMHWETKDPTRFHVVRRSDGKLLTTKYVATAFFLFHHINAYEEENHLVVDMCCFEDANIVKSLYVKALEEVFRSGGKRDAKIESRARRYVLPIVENLDSHKSDENLVKIPGSKAKATIKTDGSIFCEPDILTGEEPWSPELPRINYEAHNGRKYRYFYAMARNEKIERTNLIKVDTENRTTISWGEPDAIPSEPIFVADSGATDRDEDSGVVVASLLYRNDENKVTMLVLNAKNMVEIGRVTYVTESSVPGDFHGTFIQNS